MNDFMVFYQPQYRLSDLTLSGAEALVRKVGPGGRVVLPGEFLPEMEEDGSIVELDWFVCETAVRFLREHPKAPPVSVNFSRRHVFSPDFQGRLSDLCSGIDSRRLVVEVTETFGTELKRTCDWISAIRLMGHMVAADDFGCGYNSLLFAARSDISILKLDRSFLNGMRERVVVRNAIRMAKELSLIVIAEGVEDEGQLLFLRDCGCDCVQGFLLGRPMGEASFLKLLR